MAAAVPRLSGETTAVLSGLPDGVMVTDLGTQRLVFANEMAARLIGFESSEAMFGRPREDIYRRIEFLDEEGVPLPLEMLPPLRAMRGERPPPMELRARAVRTRAEEWATVSAFPLLDDAGNVRQVVTLFRRTTEQYRAERALRFLVKASGVLTESLDFQRTLRALAQLAVPSLADGCVVFVREDDGTLQKLSVHADPAVDAQVHELWKDRWPMRTDAPAGPPYVLRTGKPNLVHELTDDLLRACMVSEEHAMRFKALGYRSTLTVPLAVRGHLLGVVSLALIQKGRRFDDADVSVALELAGRAALAIDNARLYREAQAALARKDEEVRESERLRRLGNALVAELEPAGLIQLVTQEATAACGARYGAFLPRGEEAGVPPCAVGAPVEAVAALPRARLAPVLDDGQVVSLPEVDAARELPPGLPPSRSLLAVPVRADSSRSVGALLFGHSEPRAFSERHEHLALAVAAQASIALANARHVQRARDAEAMSRASEERLRLAIGAGRMGYFDLDLRQRRVTSTPELEALLGFAPGTFDGTVEMTLAAIHPDDRAATLQTLQRMVAEGASKGVLEFRIQTADGTVRWIEAHVRVVRDLEGVPLREIGVLVDITGRKEAEAQAQALAREQVARAEAEAARQRITAILESVAEPLIVVDRGWRIRFANRQAEALLGVISGRRKRDEFLGQDVRDLFPRERATAFLERFEAVYGGGVVELEYETVQGIWLEVRASAFDGGLLFYVRDVTARRREQNAVARRGRYEALRADVGAALASKAPLAEVLQRCADALARHLELAVVSVFLVNPQAKTLELQAVTAEPGRNPPSAGFRELPLEGSHLGMLIRERRPYISQAVQELPGFALKEWARAEELYGYAGYPFLLGEEGIGGLSLFSARPLPDDLLPTLGAIADIIAQGVERWRAEHHLALRAAELARSNAELERFAYVASHDLQEPLRMVASYVQLLARRYEGKLGSDADEFIRFAVQGATRMKRLISDLLAFSRVGTRGKPFVPVRCDEVLARVLANLQEAIRESEGQVTSAPLPEVHGDETQLEQLFQNLIGNALKFRGTSPPQVHVAAERRDGEWVFSVKDNGIGIAPEDFRRLFVIFQRLHGPMEYPGTGIGLALCKKIVERHNGRIWLESAPGQGTTFFFTLGTAAPAKA